jgi:ribonuclease HI
MKLTAVLAALRAIEGPMVVVSDATYVVDSVRRGRYVDWRRNGWKTHTCDTVANQDLGAAERAARHPRRRPRVLLGEGA